jgi:putative SOS response-associated peptidase YedK
VRSGENRCLMVADGWIDWQRPEDPTQPKQPFRHRLKTGELRQVQVQQPDDRAR